MTLQGVATASDHLAASIAVSSSNSTGFFVANIKSQVKRNRQNERRRERNRAARAEIRTRSKRAADAAAAGADDADMTEGGQTQRQCRDER